MDAPRTLRAVRAGAGACESLALVDTHRVRAGARGEGAANVSSLLSQTFQTSSWFVDVDLATAQQQDTPEMSLCRRKSNVRQCPLRTSVRREREEPS
jgi:hypothetical protein